MNIEKKLYDLYSDIIIEKFGGCKKWGGIMNKRHPGRGNMASCDYFPFKCDRIDWEYRAWFNPLNKKWFKAKVKEIAPKGTMTEVNLYALSLGDDQFFEMIEEY